MHNLAGRWNVHVRISHLVLASATDWPLALVERCAYLVVAVSVLSWQALPEKVDLLEILLTVVLAIDASVSLFYKGLSINTLTSCGFLLLLVQQD